MKIVQSTWTRFHHFDLARELHKMGDLERIFTTLPRWLANKEAIEQSIPRNLISCNFFLQGVRHLGCKIPGFRQIIDPKLAILQAKQYSNWIALNLPDCDAYIALSGSGLKAGNVAKHKGAGYIMDRGSSQIRYANSIIKEEHLRWSIPWKSVHPWLIENEESEAEEANLITVPSHFVKQTFIEHGTSGDKIRVVPYGVSLQEFYQVEGHTDNGFRILFVGGLSLRKGVPYLLKAFKDFNHPSKELILVGSIDNTSRSFLKLYSNLNIKVIGIIPRSEVKTYMSKSHVLVLPSIEEGLALVQAQAMACGCPVIATPNTGSETLFKHGQEGLIVEARNPTALTEAFTKLADDSFGRKAMSFACLERVKELRGWEFYAESMRNVAQEAKEIVTKKI